MFTNLEHALVKATVELPLCLGRSGHGRQHVVLSSLAKRWRLCCLGGRVPLRSEKSRVSCLDNLCISIMCLPVPSPQVQDPLNNIDANMKRTLSSLSSSALLILRTEPGLVSKDEVVIRLYPVLYSGSLLLPRVSVLKS
ncbi:hypothetical protein TNCV_2220581 [Trichonephila clavipes]|nr:hypothetical protein TNCV_2220581 [Trichonephila clavipes]